MCPTRYAISTLPYALRHQPFDFFPRYAYPCAVEKKRLDVLLVEGKLVESRQRAQAVILAGEVQVNGRVIDKAGARVAEGAEIVIRAPLKYVSSGGLKLEEIGRASCRERV